MTAATVALILYCVIAWIVIGAGTLILIWPMLHMARKNTIDGE